MKKIIMMLMVLAPMAVFAQKFGHVDTQAIISSMPDITRVNGELQAKAQEYENELKAMQDEFQRKVNEYEKAAPTMSETTRKDTEQQLTEMQQKMQAAYQQSQQDLQKLQQEKMQPIQQKIQTAIQNVGKAGNYTYIFEVGAPIYIGNDSKDVTAEVKAEINKLK